MKVAHKETSARTCVARHRSITAPCVPGAVIRRHRPQTRCRSFLSDITKMFGKNQGKDEVRGAEQRSTQDRSLIGSDAGRPIFPPYTVINKTSDYSLRLYSVFPVVEMEYQRREEGYATLGGYIDGKNSQGVSFAYTQPVVMCYHPDGRKVMQMYVGPPRAGSDTAASSQGEAAAAAVTSLPSPQEPGMRVNISGGELVAVLQFEGYITPATAEAARQRLMACLQRDGIRLAEADAAGRFRCAQYGAVYQLGGRLNEMMLQVNV
ncbi:hypothetical protein PLESTB_001024600 [Pleodorina starrii]|uniref:SOUL heme-binding protein n=1 Tax=Pleodorina starrii TaxID=330485 RepID=A0A9W6BPC1_9CHLO|nr:hypothetical protein PLESTM_001817400 [Pleodorina starrii]GLC55749.1 hypothetical protein PLESTB_001024600 [Pleodorina starrii]GLC68821.1 hypothetical protein PLESTF_000742100 [Pleodorina starrii]